MLNSIIKSIWIPRIRLCQKRLKNKNDSNTYNNSLEECLQESNNQAIDYLENNKNPLSRIWQYHKLTPVCGEYTTYTYAAFLNKINKNNLVYEDEIRIVGGGFTYYYKGKLGSGHHLWLERKKNNSWTVFETVPDNHLAEKSLYSEWYSLQLKKTGLTSNSKVFGGKFFLATSFF